LHDGIASRMIRQHLQFVDAQTLFVDVLAAGGMLQPGVHLDRLTDRPAGFMPQIHEIIVLVVLALQAARQIRKEVRTERLGHLLHDRLEIAVAGNEMDFVVALLFTKE